MTRTQVQLLNRLAIAAALAAAAAACGTDEANHPVFTPDGNNTPPTGSTSFVSADQGAGAPSRDNDFDSGTDAGGAPSEDEGGGGEERTVEEGDIYRLYSDNLIVNLNAYRGLQVIDFSDVSNPEVIGRLPESGTPVEMYVVGDRAIVLLNNWRGYWGARGDISFGMREGGLVLSVDISDPANPTIVDRGYIPGQIITSRLTRQGETAALYVATSEYGYYEVADGESTWETRSFVKSFDVSEGNIVSRTQLDLGGYVAAIAANTDALMVARNDWTRGDGRTSVAVIDITDPDGTMVEGQEVLAAGYIDNKRNMDMYNGVLRIVSSSTWGGINQNTVETFDASDISALTPIDTCAFGQNEQLFATLFLGNKAFFVTYLRTDPFHAFEITDDGACIEHNEYIVSGWNEFFKPAFDESRLLGIGFTDDGNRTLAVSLYDIDVLTNPEPMLARAEVDASWAWSEAAWDDRAFSVIEGAVEVPASDGTVETGLVLLPFSGWNPEDEQYFAGVQIYTFSPTTLTRRGVMEQGSQVRRSFVADDDLAANLGDSELTLFDTANPDAPERVGQVDLAPNYTDILRVGEVGARVRGSDWWGYGYGVANNRVDIVSLDENTDRADAIASFDVPVGARLHAVGTNLVVTTSTNAYDEATGSYTYTTQIDVWDLADPAAPVLASTVTSPDLVSGYYGYWGPGMAEDCFDCGGYWWGYDPSLDTASTSSALVYLEREQQSEFVTRERICNTWANEPSDCGTDADGNYHCEYINGGITCVTPEGGTESCTGSFSHCTYDETSYSCEPIEDISSITTQESCYDNDRYRYWTSFDLHVLDLTDPATATLSEAIELPVEDEGMGILADGDNVWVSFRRPTTVEGDSRPFVRWYIRPLDLSDAGSPAIGAPVNVPGQLIAANGNTVYTQDALWGEHIVETAVARLELHDGLAYLQAAHRFEDQDVHTLELDGAGNLLASHRLSWYAAVPSTGTDTDTGGASTEDPMQTLTVFDAQTLEVLSESEIDSWATLTAAQAGRALFSVPGGLLVFNLDNPASPYPQAYFATQAWPWNIRVEDGIIRFAGGNYGIYEFDINTFNLLAPI